MVRGSTVWLETWSRSMSGPFRSLWDGSNPLQGAVPGLVLEVQVRSTMSVWPKSSKIARNGSRIDGLARNKDQMNPTACADPSGPLLRPKTAKNPTFQGKRSPADLGGPRHSYRRRPGPTYHMLGNLQVLSIIRRFSLKRLQP